MPAGRPTKLTPAIQKRIVRAVRAGNYIETAAALAGVNKTTLYDWLKRGAREKDGEHYDFVLAVDQALAESEEADFGVIEKAAKGYEVVRTKEVVNLAGQVVEREEQRSTRFDWQAAAWRLERRFPERWGRPVRDLEQRLKELQETVNRLIESGKAQKPNLRVAP